MSRPTTRTAVAAVVALAILLPVSPAAAAPRCADAAPVSADGVVAWCGTTTFAGTGGEEFLLDLPAPAVFTERTPAGPRSAQFAGDAPLVALSIYTEDYRGRPGRTCTGIDTACPGGSLHMRQFAPAYSQPFDRYEDLAEGTLNEQDGRVVLPAGRYRAYLISDGTPASVSLTLGGAAGTASYTSQQRVGLDYGFLMPRLFPSGPDDGQRTIRSYGRTVAATGSSEVLTAIGLTYDLVAPVTEIGLCIYADRPQPESLDEAAYTPFCPLRATTPGGAIDIAIANVEPKLDFILRFGPETTRGVGGYVYAAAATTNAFGLTYTLDISALADR